MKQWWSALSSSEITGLGFLLCLLVFGIPFGVLMSSGYDNNNTVVSSPSPPPTPPPSGNQLLAGYDDLAGDTRAGVDVYIQGLPGQDNDPPRYEYTIIEPLVDINGERWMQVRYADGRTNYVSRDTAVFSGLYYVKSQP